MSEIFGIDVSRWQGAYDFKSAAAEGAKFVIIKCGGADGDLYTDSKFDRNYREARNAGLSVGAYFFGYATTTAEAVKEADYCATILDGKQFDYPIFYDVEAEHMDQGIDDTTAVVKAFCDRLESRGFWVGFYTNLNWYVNKLCGEELARRYTFWLASWTAAMPVIPNVQIWQFGGEYNYIRSTYVAGQVVDQSYSFVDFPAKIKAAGKNGFAKLSESEIARRWAIDNKIFIGYETGNYGWDDPITREQMAIVLYRLYHLMEGKS